MEVDRLGWLSSGRFIRALAPIAGLCLVAVVLYNATSVDRVPPGYQIKLSATDSADKALTLTSIDVVFSEEVKHDAAQRAFSIEPPIAGSFHWQGTTMIFTPSAKLPLAATFKVRVAAGVEDAVGNNQGKATEMTFTTVGPPEVKVVSPNLGQTNVSVDATIQITFDRLMDTQRVLNAVAIEPDAPFTASWKGPVLTLKPNNPLSFSTTYKIRISDSAIDTDGTRLPAFLTSFSTVDMGLRVSALVPTPNVAGVSVHTPIAVAYDGPVDPESVAGAISLTPPVSGSISVVALPDDRLTPPAPSASPNASPVAPVRNVLVFTPSGPLAAHTTYQVAVGTGVRRTDGEAAPHQSWTFTTGEPAGTGQNQIVFVSDRSGVANVWMMNPDGSNQREITSELVPVTGFDVSGDGSSIAYSAGGAVKRMTIGGDNVQTMTGGGLFEYSPMFVPDGTAIVVGRRDAVTGADLGYWRMPTVSGAETRQVATDGAPATGSVTLTGVGLTGSPGTSAWAPRAAFTPDGQKMLLVRGSDSRAALLDLTGATPPLALELRGNSRPIWDPVIGAFYLVATADDGATWSIYRVLPDGSTKVVGSALSDLTIDNQSHIGFIVRTSDGSTHLSYAVSPEAPTSGLFTADPTWSDGSPSFSPDGSAIVFGRISARGPGVSGGIWTIQANGIHLTNLAPDGAYPRWLP